MMTDYELVLNARGWARVPSHCTIPEGAGQYWQRWEGAGELDFAEFPAAYPIEMVFQNINELAFPKATSAVKLYTPS